MSWFVKLLNFLLTIIPDILPYIKKSQDPKAAFDKFVNHVKNFQK